MSGVYCTAPFNGLTIREDGHVRTCCAGNISLGNLHNDSIERIQFSPMLAEIRDSLKNNQPHENCKICVEQEQSSGISSLRQHYLKFYPNHDQDSFQLKNVDVRWNNSCNLSCLYCSPTFSSTWANKLKVSNSAPVKNYQDDLLNFILDHVHEVDEITLVGGEPMLMKQNHTLIDNLPDSARISIITNLSYDLERLSCIQKLLDRPRENTNWNISCENTDKQFEYVRSGANWQQIERNLKFLVKYWPEHISINMVYSMFSAFDLVATIQKFYTLGVRKFSFQSYQGPPAMNVFKMPIAIQELAAQELDKVVTMHNDMIHPEDRDFYPLSNLTDIQAKLKQAPSNNHSVCTKKEFYQQVAWYDQWATTQFLHHWPHVIDLVELYVE